MDEATSQLDSLTEMNIKNSLNELMKNKTTIIIAHRLSSLVNMDRILVFKSGKIIENGSHEELLFKNGMYKKLWDQLY
jgi:ATP-binding cassette subfamily B protein